MASILTTGTSQLIVDAILASGVTGTVTIVSLTLLPSPGGARKADVVLQLAITPPGQAQYTFNTTVTFTFFDDAFAEYDIFGKPQGTGPASSEPL